MKVEDLEKVTELLEAGWSGRKISRYLGLPNSTVNDNIRKLKVANLPNNPKIDKTEQLLHDGANPVEVARATKLPVKVALTNIKKLKGEEVGVDCSLRLEFSKGTSLNRLRNHFGVSSMEEAKEHIQDLFDNVLIYEKPLDSGDVLIRIIPDKTGNYNWLTQDRPDSPFRYYISPENNYMYVELDDSLPDEVRIFNFTDLHIGAKHHRGELLDAHIEAVAKDPGALVFLGGDIFEFMHKQSVGQPWEQKLAPMEQVIESAKRLMPLAHKTLRYCSGNHDRGRGQAVGADLAEMLAYLLKVPYGYIETTIDIAFKGNLFTAILHHGSGRGGSIHNILNEAEVYRKQCHYFVHWHLSGHVHNSFIVPRGSIHKVEGKGLVTQRFFTVVGGSYLARTGTYAEETKFGANPQDLTFISMKADGSYGAGSVPIDSV